MEGAWVPESPWGGDRNTMLDCCSKRDERSAGDRLARYSGEPCSKQYGGRRADGRLLSSCTVLEVKRGGGASGQGCRGNSDGGGRWEGHGESQIVLLEYDLKTSWGSKPPWQ